MAAGRYAVRAVRPAPRPWFLWQLQVVQQTPMRPRQLITWPSIQRHLVKVFSSEAQVNKRPIFIFILQPHLRHHGLLCDRHCRLHATHVRQHCHPASEARGVKIKLDFMTPCRWIAKNLTSRQTFTSSTRLVTSKATRYCFCWSLLAPINHSLFIDQQITLHSLHNSLFIDRATHSPLLTHPGFNRPRNSLSIYHGTHSQSITQLTLH
jgi:hypothetical protein